MRVAGDTRITTATGIADDHGGSAATVLLARVDDFPDALAAGPARGGT